MSKSLKRKIEDFFNRLKAVVFGYELSDVQYKTEKTIKRKERPTMEEGGLEVKFSKLDKSGIVIKDKNQKVISTSERIPNNKVKTRIVQKDSLAPEESNSDFVFFDCPDLHGTFKFVGVRDGSLHMMCSDEMGVITNITVDGVFKRSGFPRTNGFVVRKPKRGGAGKTTYDILGYIDLTNYIGIRAATAISFEDIVRDGLQNIRLGRSRVPEDILAKIG